MISFLLEPFFAYPFMKRALVACFILSLSGAPLGVFLLLRRMSLVGDAMSHALLPGVAVGFLVFGFSIPAMLAGGFAAGLFVALTAGLATRFTRLREDANFASIFLVALALGVLLMSFSGERVDLMHILFGSVMAVDSSVLIFVASISTLSLVLLVSFLRPLVIESFDPEFHGSIGGPGTSVHLLLMALVALNLVAAFQALGTLMAVGLMMLPAAAARLWTSHLINQMFVAIVMAMVSSYLGLLGSFHLDLPSGPAIILVAGSIYFCSLLSGSQGGVLWKLWLGPHMER